MIIQGLITLFINILSVLFAWLPTASTLPVIGGYDIDAALSSNIGMFYTYANAVWPIMVVFQGFLVLVAYYTIKMILKFFLGHRAPGTH